MTPRGAFVFAGSFSLINRELLAALRRRSGSEIREMDAVPLALRGRPFACAGLYAAATWIFLPVVVRHRIPPRDLIPRLPVFSQFLKERVAGASNGLAWTLQTQSLFDASGGRVPHFVYTDHTHLANTRYSLPRETWPVAPGWLALERRVYANARAIFTSSRFAADSLREDYAIGEDKVVVAGSGGNIVPPESCPVRQRGREIRLLFVGVEWERKGGPELAAALSRLRRDFPDVVLDVVGCEGSGDGIRFHGRLEPQAVRAFYEKADVFCLPSRAEPSAGVLAEAAAFGLPVVATRVGGTPERVIDGETGFLVPAGDVEALEHALRRLVTDPDLGARMGRAGWELARKEFTWDAVATRILTTIERKLSE